MEPQIFEVTSLTFGGHMAIGLATYMLIPTNDPHSIETTHLSRMIVEILRVKNLINVENALITILGVSRQIKGQKYVSCWRL